MEGSIRKEARLIKITIRLVDTVNGLQVWGDQYQRQLRPDKLIALQEEIAQKVAAKIGSEYGIIPRNLSKESRMKPPESLDTYEAFLHFYHHVNVLTSETFEETLRILEQAVTREPECGLAWSQLAHLYVMNYTLQFSPLKTPLEQALVFAKKAVSLDSQNQQVRATMAYLYFRRDERDLFLLEAEKAIALNPNSPFLTGYLGWLLALYGEWDRGLAIMGKGMELNPHYPGWFHLAPYLYLYLQRRYEDAYLEALPSKCPNSSGTRSCALQPWASWGKRREAAQAVAEMLRLKQDFTTNGPFLIGCYVKFKDLADALLDGLRLAGLKI